MDYDSPIYSILGSEEAREVGEKVLHIDQMTGDSVFQLSLTPFIKYIHLFLQLLTSHLTRYGRSFHELVGDILEASGSSSTSKKHWICSLKSWCRGFQPRLLFLP